MPEVRRYIHQDRINYPRGTPCQRRLRKVTSLVGDQCTFSTTSLIYLHNQSVDDLRRLSTVDP